MLRFIRFKNNFSIKKPCSKNINSSSYKIKNDKVHLEIADKKNLITKKIIIFIGHRHKIPHFHGFFSLKDNRKPAYFERNSNIYIVSRRY